MDISFLEVVILSFRNSPTLGLYQWLVDWGFVNLLPSDDDVGKTVQTQWMSAGTLEISNYWIGATTMEISKVAGFPRGGKAHVKELRRSGHRWYPHADSANIPVIVALLQRAQFGLTEIS